MNQLKFEARLEQEPIAQLVRPSLVFKDSYLAAVDEALENGEEQKYTRENLEADFEYFLKHLENQENEPSEGSEAVPQAVFWLTKGKEYIGRVTLRHRLNEELLKKGGNIGYDIRPSQRKQGYGAQALTLAIQEAKGLGLTRVLVTCDSDNEGSRKIIEANGGILENEVQSAIGPNWLRYWIDIA
jgi:predicted acetyltransferase